jgi:F-type H+-transporting ATPase subunit b
MDSIISTFHIDWKVIIAQAVNFGIVFVVLYVFALKPLSKLMTERSERIAKGLDDAKSNRETLEKTKSEYDKVIIEARAEASTLFGDTKKQAESERTAMIEKTKSEIEEMVAKGKKTLETEKTKMVEEAKGEIVALGTQIAEKLIMSKVASKTDGSLNDKSVEELERL